MRPMHIAAFLIASLPLVAQAQDESARTESLLAFRSGRPVSVLGTVGIGNAGPTAGARFGLNLSPAGAIDLGFQVNPFIVAGDVGARAYLGQGQTAPYLFGRAGAGQIMMLAVMPFVEPELLTSSFVYLSPGAGVEWVSDSGFAMSFEGSAWLTPAEDLGNVAMLTVGVGYRGGGRARARDESGPAEFAPSEIVRLMIEDARTKRSAAADTPPEPPRPAGEQGRVEGDMRCLGGFPDAPDSGTCPSGTLCRDRVCVEQK